MKKNKGFTLIELLAVIIVLAIIMVLTIPNVLSTMNNSKKQALVVFGKKAIVQAQKHVAELELDGTPVAPTSDSPVYYSLAEIGITDAGSYKGGYTDNKAVEVSSGTDGLVYKVKVNDGSNYICGATLNDMSAAAYKPSGSNCA